MKTDFSMSELATLFNINRDTVSRKLQKANLKNDDHKYKVHVVAPALTKIKNVAGAAKKGDRLEGFENSSDLLNYKKALKTDVETKQLEKKLISIDEVESEISHLLAMFSTFSNELIMSLEKKIHCDETMNLIERIIKEKHVNMCEAMKNED